MNEEVEKVRGLHKQHIISGMIKQVFAWKAKKGEYPQAIAVSHEKYQQLLTLYGAGDPIQHGQDDPMELRFMGIDIFLDDEILKLED